MNHFTVKYFFDNYEKVLRNQTTLFNVPHVTSHLNEPLINSASQKISQLFQNGKFSFIKI